MLEEDETYDGYEQIMKKPGINVYRKEDPDHPSIPFLRLEIESNEIYPD